MKTYLDCWIAAARALFSASLAGGVQLIDSHEDEPGFPGLAFAAEISGDVAGRFSAMLDPLLLDQHLLGDGVDQTDGQIEEWTKLLAAVAEAAAKDLLASAGQSCRVDSFGRFRPVGAATRAFRLICAEGSWSIHVYDELRTSAEETEALSAVKNAGETEPAHLSPGVELLMDVELEAALRFGGREMPLGEILELGPGDVVELDRHVSDPVDLVIGDKIVARGEVVLVNGNFGLRVTEVAAPQKRLESIRCLF